jgi:hypothetical protein
VRFVVSAADKRPRAMLPRLLAMKKYVISSENSGCTGSIARGQLAAFSV